MQEALIDTTNGVESPKQLQQLLAWSDEELLEPTLGNFKTPADAQKRINQLTQTIKMALLLLVKKPTDTTSNTSENSTSESSTSSTTSETSNTPSVTSETSSKSESSASSTTSETNSTSESSTPSTVNENSQNKGQNSIIYAEESNQDPNDYQSNSKTSTKASQKKESSAESQATKQVQTNQKSSETVKKADNTTKIAKKKLPKTGEQTSAVGGFLGLSLLSLATATYCFKVKR